MTVAEFSQLRYGMFVHFGLFSQLGRGEWAMNREGFSRDEYRRLAADFNPENFDADAIADLSVRAGMKYLVFTTMHHEGFRLYDSRLNDFNAAQVCGRDLVAEVVAAARQRGLKIGLYHSLNNWMDAPDACDALENRADYETFLANTFARLEEIVSRFSPDILWYDGWWPFDARGWQAEAMNANLRAIRPALLFNGRNGLDGDFATPEGHLTAPTPYRVWEACLTLNQSWGYHAGDHDWKSPWQIVEALATCASGGGNLLLNVAPRGDGSLPEISVEILETVGKWLQIYGEAIFDTDRFIFGPHERQSDHRGDWCHWGPFTAKDANLYLLARRWPGRELALSGLDTPVSRVVLLGPTEREASFDQRGGRLRVRGLPLDAPDELCSVLRIECNSAPSLYSCAGMRVPAVPHPRYDPLPSEIHW